MPLIIEDLLIETANLKLWCKHVRDYDVPFYYLESKNSSYSLQGWNLEKILSHLRNEKPKLAKELEEAK